MPLMSVKYYYRTMKNEENEKENRMKKLSNRTLAIILAALILANAVVLSALFYVRHSREVVKQETFTIDVPSGDGRKTYNVTDSGEHVTVTEHDYAVEA